MDNQKEHHSIIVCMGSSCFAHGSKEILDTIQKYLSLNAPDTHIEITGSLCQGICKKGPSISIDNKPYSYLTVEKVLTILKKIFDKSGIENE